MKVEKTTTSDIETLVVLRLEYLKEDIGNIEERDIETIKESLPGYYSSHMNKDLHCYIIREKDAIVSCAFLLIVEKPSHCLL